MADTPGTEASHDSGQEDGGDSSSKLHAVKDRECQYCHQKFTSSSLGRHLDQYLHKKKPDGIHNVDEIRRLRGGITRRTARHGSKNEYEESRTSNASPAPARHSPSGPVVDTLNVAPLNGMGTKFNAMNWHSTGVINNLKDIPSMPTTIASPVGSASGKRNFSTFAGIEQPTVRSSGADSEKDTTIRALELSLHEVLDNVHAATARGSPRPSPFTFDLQTQTFPSLVLQLLPHPPTLFSAAPFATSTSAPLAPPDSTHLPLLRLNLETQVQTWKWDALRYAQTQTFPTAHAANLGEEADYLSDTASQYEEFSKKHLDASFQAWASLPSQEKDEKWILELMRFGARKSQKAKELEERLETLTSEANRLQGQVEYLSRCQWPREFALFGPEPIKFSKVASEELRGINLDASETEATDKSGGSGAMSSKEMSERWNYDRLVGKWKRRVREDGLRRIATATAIPPGSRLNEIQRESLSLTPPMQANGNGDESRRKDGRQSLQPQYLVTSSADQDKRVREFNKSPEEMSSR